MAGAQETDGKKNKLRTSKDVYNRLKWDSDSLGIDLSSIYIGYKDRFLGMCEIPLHQFQPLSQESEESGDGGASEIPYHRIYYFRGGGPPLFPLIGSEGEVRVREENWPPNAIFYWDRETRQDLIFNSGDAPSSKRGQESISTWNQPIYKFNKVTEQWEDDSSKDDENVPNFGDDPLTLLSFNVLNDLYVPRIVQCPTRWPHLIDFLNSKNADIIALQEVTVSFLLLLEKEEWVKNHYYLSDISPEGETVNPYGQIFLTKFKPNRLLFRNDKSGKGKFVIASFPLPSGKLVHIANIHLTSNARGDSTQKRQAQIEALLKTMGDMEIASATAPHDFVIVGDTNFSKNESIWYDHSFGMELMDVWTMLNEEVSPDESMTFDTINNKLAKAQSKSGKSERFDRIFIKSSNVLKPIQLQIIGKAPINEDLWLSDHYGLECQFKMQLTSTPMLSQNIPPQISKQTAVYTSAIVIIPPESFWPQVQPLREIFDPSFTRWPPHITLFFKFIPDIDNNFDLAETNLAPLLQDISPFKCTLSRVGTFTHSRSTTIYLGPVEKEAVSGITTVYNKLTSLYPGFTDKKEGFSYTPHLTLGRLTRESDIEKKLNDEYLKKWTHRFEQEKDPNSLSFTVDRIHFISREEDTPFKIRKTIMFGKKTGGGNHGNHGNNNAILEDFITQHQLSATCPQKEDARIKIPEKLAKICNILISRILKKPEGENNSHCTLHLTGSTFLGFHDDTSDLDLLCVGPPQISTADFFSGLEAVMKETETSPGFELLLQSVVMDTTIPIARLTNPLHNIDIDLVYSNHAAENPLNIDESILLNMNETELRSINAVRECHKLLEMVPSQMHPVFISAVRLLKYWAKERNIFCKTFGFLGSTQISMLVAYVIGNVAGENATVVDVISDFFKTFASWKWQNPVQFHSENAQKYTIVRKSGKVVPEIMPILSPAFPRLNRNLNVTKSTKSFMQTEFRRGNEILNGEMDFKMKWEQLVTKQDFFASQEKYLCVQICSENEADGKVANGILQSGTILSFIVELEQKCELFVQPDTNVILKNEHKHEMGGRECHIGGDENYFVCLTYVGVSQKVRGQPFNVKNICGTAIAHFKQKLVTSLAKFCERRTDVHIFEKL